MSTRMRSFAKGVMWQTIGTCITLTFVFIFTQNVPVTATVGVLDLVFKVIFYYFHERFWDGISWGKTDIR